MACRFLATPNFLRHLDKQPELGSLVLHRQLIAEHGAGKAVLWTDAELVERDVLACLVDAALQIIGAFQLAGLGGNRSQVQPFSAQQTAERCKITDSLVAAGKPNQLMLIPDWWWVISARTYLDRFTNAPDFVENAAKIKCPVLFIRGDREPTDNYPAERFKENCAGPCEVVIVPNCDHFYTGAEEPVAKTVTHWLSQTLSD